MVSMSNSDSAPEGVQMFLSFGSKHIPHPLFPGMSRNHVVGVIGDDYDAAMGTIRERFSVDGRLAGYSMHYRADEWDRSRQFFPGGFAYVIEPDGSIREVG